jgi:hypothetical protein
MFRSVAMSVVPVMAFACSAVALAAEPSETFEAMYGADFKKVKASRGLDDDVGLASQLVAAAKDARPEYATVLCEKAYELAERSPTGCDKAAEAMETLAEKVPARKAECLARSVPARQRLFKAAKGFARVEAGEVLIDAMLAAADALCEAADGKAVGMVRQASGIAKAVAPNRQGEVLDAIVRIGTRLRVEKQVAGLKKRLAADSGDAASRTTLVRLLVVELDDPARAIPFLEGCTDEAMCKFVPAAAKPIGEAPELACKELGEWYDGLSQKAGSAAKEPTLVRAWQYLERYLRIHETEDLARAEAAKTMENVEAALEKLGEPKGAVVGPGRWVGLFRRVDPTKDTMTGEWQRKGLALVCAANGGRVRIPCLVEGNYEILVRFQVLKVIKPGEGHGVWLQFPAGRSAFRYHFSNRGAFGGLGGVREAPAVPPGTQVVGREYLLGVRVLIEDEDAQITVLLDGKPHLRWRGPPPQLSSRPGSTLPDTRSPELQTGHTSLALTYVRLRMFSGKMRLLR